MALCLTVKDYEFIYIGKDIRISVARKSAGEVSVWIEAPKDQLVLRQKHKDQMKADDVPTGTD